MDAAILYPFPTMTSKLNWGILAAGGIAQAFARGLKQCKTGNACAIASRDAEKAKKFASDFGIEKSFGSYDDLLNDPKVDAVYVATPHPQHLEWAMKAIARKKHVLIEKPIAINHADAMAIFAAAREHDVFVMEAFMYRCHPQTVKLIELIKSGVIGDVRVINATFSFHAHFKEESRLFANEYAGGGILDVGCYTVSISRLIAGAALGKEFADPIEIKGVGHVGESRVDEWAIGTLKFERGILAQLATGIALNQESVVRIFGLDGKITLPNPYPHDRIGGEVSTIIVERYKDKSKQEIRIETDVTSYALEADAFAAALSQNRREAIPPVPTRADTLSNMRVLDRWRAEIGLVYDEEKPEGYRRTTARGKTLVRSNGGSMKFGTIANLDRPVSRLIMGVDNQRNLPHAAVMFDDFFERGGNTFDTAHVYAGGAHEKLLGDWIQIRGVRNDVNVIVKGAHTPHCNPHALTTQLLSSLERLQIGHADIYMMHRDNPDIPVREFVDVLNEHVRAGRIKAFGGSNWSNERVAEANDYARKNGLQGFSVVSNNLSLARMNKPIWDGCVIANDPASVAFFKTTQIPLLSWSSQARGFFVPGLADPAKTDNREMVEIWYNDQNFERLRRANELAAKLNVSPMNLALAWVLNQAFPTFALIGPRTLEETRTSWPALQITLSPEKVAWLNLQ